MIRQYVTVTGVAPTLPSERVLVIVSVYFFTKLSRHVLGVYPQRLSFSAPAHRPDPCRCPIVSSPMLARRNQACAVRLHECLPGQRVSTVNAYTLQRG